MVERPMIHVTEVLEYCPEPELVAWQLSVGKAKVEKIGTEAKRIGSLVDRWIQQELLGELPGALAENEVESRNCLVGWQQFKQDFSELIASVVGIQRELVTGDLVGHPDIEIQQGERWGFLDVKCAGAIRPKYWTQTAKYTEMARRMAGTSLPPCFLGILRLDKRSDLLKNYEYVEWNDLEKIQYEVEMFDHYLAIYRHGQQVQEWRRQALEREVLCSTK